MPEETVFEPLRAQTEGAFVGTAGMRRFLADTAETFDLFKATYPDIRDLGEGRLGGRVGQVGLDGGDLGVTGGCHCPVVAEGGLQLRVVELLGAQPALMFAGPAGPSAIDAAVP